MDAPSGAHPALAGLRAAAALAMGAGAWPADATVGWLWLWLGVLGLAWGAALGLVWGGSTLVFAWYILPLMPAALVLVAMGVGPFRGGLPSLAARLGGAGGSPTAGAVLVAALALGLLGLRPHTPNYSDWMAAWLRWTRPEPEYRALLLMPLWGAWAMMVQTHFCRPSDRAGALDRAFARSQPVAATALWLAVALAATLWYFDFFGRWAFVPAASALLGSAGGSVWLARRGGGLDRAALLAGHLAGALALLLGYLAGKGLLNIWH